VKRSLFLVEDGAAERWFPFSLTRPVGELLFGTLLLRERIERATGLQVTGYVAPAALLGFQEHGTPPVQISDWDASHQRILLLSSYVPPLARGDALSLSLPLELPPGGLRLEVDDVTVGWMIPGGDPLPDPAALRALARREREERQKGDGGARTEGAEVTGAGDGQRILEVPGDVLTDPWTLMTRNDRQILQDLEALDHGAEGGAHLRSPDSLPGVHVLGSHPILAEDGVRVDPGVVMDVRHGPVYLSRNVQVESSTRLVGPAFIGPESVLLGGVIRRVSCGPVCKLHGEIDSTVVLGFANKAHDGYLGHSVLGRWVNLGAMTTNSDLKNTYGTVRIPIREGKEEIETGLLKVGVFLGDHVRTGIGTLLNTGTVVGPGSNLFGGPMPPRYVPPFSWGTGERLETNRKEPFLTTVERVMARRDLELTGPMRALLAGLWDRTRGGERA